MRCDERRLFICRKERYNLYRQVNSELITFCMRHLKWIILGFFTLTVDTFTTTPRKKYFWRWQ